MNPCAVTCVVPPAARGGGPWPRRGPGGRPAPRPSPGARVAGRGSACGPRGGGGRPGEAMAQQNPPKVPQFGFGLGGHHFFRRLFTQGGGQRKKSLPIQNPSGTSSSHHNESIIWIDTRNKEYEIIDIKSDKYWDYQNSWWNGRKRQMRKKVHRK